METLVSQVRILLGLFLLAAGAAGASVPEPCRSAQFTIDGEPIGTGATTSRTIEIGTLAGLGDVCPPTASVKRRTTKRGVTQVRARWLSCPGLAGPVRLRARVVDGCTRVVGR